eukprot:3567063-Pyramimonas_sp.AAC.1
MIVSGWSLTFLLFVMYFLQVFALSRSRPLGVVSHHALPNGWQKLALGFARTERVGRARMQRALRIPATRARRVEGVPAVNSPPALILAR